MIIKELSQLSSLKKEVSMLEDQLKKQRDEYSAACSEQNRTFDTVQGSSKSYPYCLHTMTIEGASKEITNSRERTRKAVAKTIAQLWDKKAECAEEQQRLTEFINSIDDSRIRQILSLRYIDGLEWKDVAAKMGYEESEDSVRKACKRFLEKF